MPESFSSIENALSTLRKIKPQTYDKKDSLNSTNPTSRESGVIAQQIWYQVPELRHIVNLAEDANPDENIVINTDPTQDPDYSSWGSTPASVNYNCLTAYLIKAVQELSDEVTDLKSQLNL